CHPGQPDTTRTLWGRMRRLASRDDAVNARRCVTINRNPRWFEPFLNPGDGLDPNGGFAEPGAFRSRRLRRLPEIEKCKWDPIADQYGRGQPPRNLREIEKRRQHLVCIEWQTGKVLWLRSPPTRFPDDRLEGFVTDHGHFSCTPASDGECVFELFEKSGVYAFNFDGKP
ncbi:MAG: hypothetical protein AAF989_06805, partial [Planctomycetota bacterium]